MGADSPRGSWERSRLPSGISTLRRPARPLPPPPPGTLPSPAQAVPGMGGGDGGRLVQKHRHSPPPTPSRIIYFYPTSGAKGFIGCVCVCVCFQQNLCARIPAVARDLQTTYVSYLSFEGHSCFANPPSRLDGPLVESAQRYTSEVRVIPCTEHDRSSPLKILPK